MNMIEVTSLTNETFIINLDHVVAIKKDLEFSVSDGTRYATVILSSGQLIPISKTDFTSIMCQLTDQYRISVIED